MARWLSSRRFLTFFFTYNPRAKGYFDSLALTSLLAEKNEHFVLVHMLCKFFDIEVFYIEVLFLIFRNFILDFFFKTQLFKQLTSKSVETF